MEFELKRWKESYLEALKAFSDDKNAAKELPASLPRKAKEAEAYISARLLADDEKELCRAVLVGGKPVGAIELRAGEGVYRRTATLSFWIAREYRRRGIMGAALAELSEIAFERLDVVRIDALVPAGNVAARCALNSAGYALEGTLSRRAYIDGAYDDVCVYALLK